MNLILQTFHPDGGATFKQRFNPVIYKLNVSVDRDATVDRRPRFGGRPARGDRGRQDS